VAVFYTVFAFNTSLLWNWEAFTTGNWSQILSRGTSNLLIQGYLSFALTVIYSVVAGITLVSSLVALRSTGLEKSVGGALPGFLVAGCSCGVGLASLIGLAGFTAALPFNGELVKAGGIVLMFYALSELGRSGTCDVRVNLSS